MTKIAVLDGKVLVLFLPSDVSDRQVAAILAGLRAELPGWHYLVFPGPGSVLDLRGDPEAARLAAELWERVSSIVEPAA
jgi:hypothetical protein